MPRSSAGVRSARYRKYGPQARTIVNQMNMPEQLKDELGFLGVITNREGLVALIQNEHAPGSYGYKLILDAHDTAKRVMIRRRHSGEREFKHAFRCALILWIFCGVRDPCRIAGEFLHDLWETYRRKWNLERITARFDAMTAGFVDMMTKPVQRKGKVSKREAERRFYERLETASREDVENKGADVLDNLLTLWARSAKRKWRKIDDVVRFVLPLLHKHGLEKLRRAIILVLWEIRRKLRNNIAFAH